MVSLNIRTFRRVALVGLAVALMVDFDLSLRVAGGTALGVVVLLAMVLAVGFTSLVLMPRATPTLLHNRDLLVPLLLLVVANKVLKWLTAAPLFGAFLQPALPLNPFKLNFGFSLSFLLQIGLAVAYANWMIAAVLALARTGDCDPC